MLARLRYITLVLTLSVVLTLYLTLLVVTVPVVDRVASENTGPRSAVKEVVAFSLRKTIEIDSEEVSCDRTLKTPRRFRAEKSYQHWTKIPNTNLYVFDVYYDDRLDPFAYLRLLGMIEGPWNRTLYCQTESENGTIHITKAARKEIWEKEWDAGDENTFNPVLISCYLPTNFKPKKLSVNTNPCEFSSVYFPVKLPRFKKSPTDSNVSPKKFIMTVCVKPLKFSKDISRRLMQWIEINRILGADRFEIYVDEIGEETKKTLEFYGRKYKRSFSVKYYRNVEDFASRSLNGNETEPEKIASRSGNALITKQTPESSYVTTSEEEEKEKADKHGVKNEYLGSDSNGSVKKKTRRQNHLNDDDDDDEKKEVHVGIERETSTTTVIGNTEATKTRRRIWQKRRNELIAYNDCLYRNLHSSHFVIPVDIDEIIVPKQFHTWNDLLGQVFVSLTNAHEEFASFSVRNAYFLEEFSGRKEKSTGREEDLVFFLEYDERSEFSLEGESGKSFVSTRNTLTVFNHYSLDVLKPGIRKIYFLPVELVQMNHYKPTCSVELLPQCAKYLSSPVRVVDTLIRKYKEEFAEKYEKNYAEFRNCSAS